MLSIAIGGTDSWDEKEEEFVSVGAFTLVLEHSLVALSKWEANWEKPFLGSDTKTDEQTIDYIKCMTITPDVDPKVYELLTKKHISDISEYIDRKMTATWFSDAGAPKKPSPNREVITADIIYYWMFSLNIPLDFENRHLNQLLTIVQVMNRKNAPEKKMTQRELLERNKRLNEERRARFNTNG